ncbi:hypothetical protein ACU61Z_08805 [Klebsiella aerogenes]
MAIVPTFRMGCCPSASRAGEQLGCNGAGLQLGDALLCFSQPVVEAITLFAETGFDFKVAYILLLRLLQRLYQHIKVFKFYKRNIVAEFLYVG